MTGWKCGSGRNVAGVALALLTVGCAKDQGPLRVNGVSRSSTVGSDFSKIPRGVTIPAAGFGVDLVGRPASPGVVDPQTLPARATTEPPLNRGSGTTDRVDRGLILRP